jgi:hypothetical protein
MERIIPINPYRKCHSNIFVFPFLSNHVFSRMYEEDLLHYRRILRQAAREDGNKTFFWVSRADGTFCRPEIEVFTPNTVANHDARYWPCEPNDKIFAFLIEVTGVVGNEVIGDVYELDRKVYHEMVQRFKTAAIKAHELITGEQDMSYRMIPVAPATMASLLRYQKYCREHLTKAG